MADPTTGDAKMNLRRELRARLAAIPPERQAHFSKRGCEALLATPTFREAQSLLLYMPLQGELDVRLILEKAIQEGRSVALPRFVPETGHYAAFMIGEKPLAAGPFGILEPDASMPVPLNRLDLIIVPGLGFDLLGRRLGRGKGFYDRMLAEVSGVKCGICFDEQIVESIPAEAHDVAMNFVATPTRWLDCRGSAPDLR